MVVMVKVPMEKRMALAIAMAVIGGAEGALAVVKAQARRRVKVEGLQVVSMDWVTVEVG